MKIDPSFQSLPIMDSASTDGNLDKDRTMSRLEQQDYEKLIIGQSI